MKKVNEKPEKVPEHGKKNFGLYLSIDLVGELNILRSPISLHSNDLRPIGSRVSAPVLPNRRWLPRYFVLPRSCQRGRTAARWSST